MKKLNIQNEQGRSMVEMLGVLAIIGVLSVGGIAGYTTAMRSHRANEIVNACSLLYVVANTKNESGGIEYQTVLGTRPTGVSELKYNNGTITANITDVAVCTEVKNKLGDRVTGDCAALAVTLGEVKQNPNTISDSTECISQGFYWNDLGVGQEVPRCFASEEDAAVTCRQYGGFYEEGNCY